MSDLYFEDLAVGQRFECAPRTVEEAEIIAFARAFDPQYFHTDPLAAAGSAFGGLVASGFHTLSLSFRCFFDLDLWRNAIVASPGLDEVRWLAPLRPGDTLYVSAEVTHTRRSRSNPGRGIVVMHHQTRNQHATLILSVSCPHILALRDAGP